jgi:hypothetical protein
MPAWLLSLALVACGSSAPPPVYTPMAADNGQPKMQATLLALQHAQSEVTEASPNHGGHREQALALIQQAIGAVNEGIQYAASHANEVGPAEGPAGPEPVDEEVAGGGHQPHMSAGIVALREARRQLREAKPDKGGYRAQGLALIDQAIVQLKEGIRFANVH